MLVTILSDGSWCPKTHAAGYGWYAVSGRGRSHGGGSLMGTRASSGEVEICAAVNALHFALKYGIAEAGDPIVLQLDSTEAIEKMQAALVTEAPGLLDIPLATWRALVTGKALSVSLRHVKGHVSPEKMKESPRHYCNDLCDRRAREGMREARRQLEGKLCTPTTKAIA